MQETQTSLQGIFDIESPAMPFWLALQQEMANILFFGLIVASAIVLITFFLWHRYFSRKGKARRQLNRLQRRLDGQLLDAHQAAFELSDILRNALNLRQLSGRTTLPEAIDSQQENWSAFIERLATARYSASGYEKEQLLPLFKAAEHWLNHWPRIKHV